MKFGVRLMYGLLPEGFRDVARRAEQLGYESLWTGDHLVLPRDYSSVYPYGKLAADSHHFPVLDSINLLGHLAATTSRIRLAVGVYVLPLRDPFVTASAVRTLDFLSNGRAIFGVGVGWLREEFTIVGQNFDNRGARTDECLALLKALWTQEEPEFRGEFYSFPAVGFEPKPIQQPHPPILIGGESAAALDRAARLGDGWCAHPQDAESLKKKLAIIAAKRRDLGKDVAHFDATVRVASAISIDDVRRLEEIGIGRVILEFGDVNRLDPKRVAARFADDLEGIAHTLLSRV